MPRVNKWGNDNYLRGQTTTDTLIWYSLHDLLHGSIIAWYCLLLRNAIKFILPLENYLNLVSHEWTNEEIITVLRGQTTTDTLT